MSRGKSFYLISLNGEYQVIHEGLNGAKMEDSIGLTISSNSGKALTLLLPVAADDPEPIITSLDSGRTHLFRVGKRCALVHLGTGRKWGVPRLDFTSDSDYLIATWEENDQNRFPLGRSLLGKSGSTTVWREDSIKLGDKSNPNSNVLVWDEGITTAPIDTSSKIVFGKAPGLKSRPLDIKEGLADPGNYAWKCDRARLSAHFKEGQAPDSYFLPVGSVERIKSDTGSWKEMLNAYGKLKLSLKNPSLYPEDKLPFLVAYIGFMSRINQDSVLKAWTLYALSKLDTMPLKVESLTEMRAHYAWWYLTAYDLLSPSLTRSQREEVQAHLRLYLKPVLASIPYLAVNATDLVLKSSVGLAGILLDEPDWVDMMVNHLDWYLDFGAPEGIAYEGNLYLGIAFNYVPAFADILNRAEIGEADFFKDERFQSLIASMIMQVSPNWDYPCFEDCIHSGALNGLIASAGAGFSRVARATGNQRLLELASMCKWVEMNAHLPPEHAWLPDLPLYFEAPATPEEPTFPFLSAWMPEYRAKPGMAAFLKFRGGAGLLRNGWGAGSELFALSAKNYDQAHTHMDELSFELWSIGENWLSNPPYAGFGEKLHALSTMTQSSNSLTINGQSQVNPKGCRMSNGVFGKRIGYFEAEGVGLYRNPDRGVFNGIAIASAIVLGWMWIMILSAVSSSRYNTAPPEFTIRKGRGRAEDALTMNLPIKALTTPLARKSDLKRLAALFSRDGISRKVDKIAGIGCGIQGGILGLVLFLGSAYYFHIVAPFIQVYADDKRYEWMGYFLKAQGLFFAMAFAAGFALYAANCKLIEVFWPGARGVKSPGSTMPGKIMRMIHMDLSSPILIAFAVAMTLALSKSNIRLAILGSNFDPWSLQSHLCSYVSRPLLGIVLFMLLKMLLQCLTARKYAYLLFYITGKRHWYSYGWHSALMAISLKKSSWLAVCLLLFYLMLRYSGHLSAEELTFG